MVQKKKRYEKGISFFFTHDNESKQKRKIEKMRICLAVKSPIETKLAWSTVRKMNISTGFAQSLMEIFFRTVKGKKKVERLIFFPPLLHTRIIFLLSLSLFPFFFDKIHGNYRFFLFFLLIFFLLLCSVCNFFSLFFFSLFFFVER